MRRSEAIRTPTPSKNVAPQALVRKSKPSPTNNSSGTFGGSTPGLTNDNSSISSSIGRLPTPQGNGQFQGTPNGVWQMSSMGSENATMAPSLNGTDFDLPQTKSPTRLEDFPNDANFDAFGLDQDDDRFSDIMDLDFGFPDFMTKDELDISAVRKSSALESGDTRAVASLLQSPQGVRGHAIPPDPPQPSWTNFGRSESTSSNSHHSTNEAKTSFSQKPMQCDCLTTTLSLLENVHFREPHASASTLIHLLHEFKQWVNFFKGVASCTMCKFVTDSLMLLVVVCEKLADSFRVVLNVYEKLAETMSENSGVPLEARMLIGEYRIDTVEELACLFVSLALRHLQSLHVITLSLDKKAVQEKLTTHHELLQRLYDKHRAMKATLRQAHLKGS